MSSLSNEARLVRDALLARGLETPRIETSLSASEQREQIEAHMRGVMEILGLDMRDDSLAETPIHGYVWLSIELARQLELLSHLICRALRK